MSIVSVYRKGICLGFISFEGGRRWLRTLVYHSEHDKQIAVKPEKHKTKRQDLRHPGLKL